MMNGAMKAACALKATARPHQARDVAVRPRIIAATANMQPAAHKASHCPSSAAFSAIVGTTNVNAARFGSPPSAFRRSATANARKPVPATDKSLMAVSASTRKCPSDAAASR